MKVVVAGCGWLGTRIASELRLRGDRVVGVRRGAERARELEPLGVDPLAIDLSRSAAARELPRDADAVIACQAAAGRTEEDYRRAYLDVTSTLLEYASQRPLRALVYTGSTGVFGQRSGEVVDETTPPEPDSARAEILVRAERLLLDAGRERGLPVRIVRLSGLYGPGRFGVIERVRSGRLALGPDEESWMNFCHRTDAARAAIAVLDRGRDGAVYHGSDASPVRRRDLVRWVAARLGIEPHRVPEGVGPGDRGGRGRNRSISSERTRRELDIELRYPSFREGLTAALAPPGSRSG